MSTAFANIALFYSLNCCADACIAKLGFRLNTENPSIVYEFCKDELNKFGAKTTKTKTLFINWQQALKELGQLGDKYSSIKSEDLEITITVTEFVEKLLSSCTESLKGTQPFFPFHL